MQNVYFSDFAPELQEKFYSYLAKYDCKFTKTADDMYSTILKPPRTFESDTKPRFTVQFPVVPHGKLFNSLDYNRYGSFILFAKNFQKIPCRAASVEDLTPLPNGQKYFDDIIGLIIQQQRQLTSFEFIATYFGTDYQKLVNFCYFNQLNLCQYQICRILSTLMESNCNSGQVKMFCDVLRYLLAEFELTQVEPLLKLYVPQSIVQKISKDFFGKYYEYFCADELKPKEVNGDMLLHTMYFINIRYGMRCRRAEATKKADLVELSTLQVNLNQKDFETQIESVMLQYADQCKQIFSLTDPSHQKLINEISTVLRIYVNLLTHKEQYEKYINTVFLKKADKGFVEFEMQKVRDALIQCQTKAQAFDVLKTVVTSETIKTYLDAFVTSLIILQGR
ncbi:Conserved_hypothetical protein [Hexamita inflata]|uniref:Uncharacterized protein n=1 Tax=Hexamita inflata TaxID=28002 RepID=A0AA86RFI9_9EUKA|nr:Conserved hypothetical protein [Hexamita inflata]